MVVPVESTGDLRTGLVLFNPGFERATVDLSLVEASGWERARTEITLESRQMLLANGRSYRFSATLKVTEMRDAPGHDDSRDPDCLFVSEGTLTFPGREVDLMGDTLEEIDLPAVPDFVTIYGRVTDRSGQGVRARVKAQPSPLLAGVVASFMTAAETDHNGYYRLLVPSGTEYELLFQPPASSP